MKRQPDSVGIPWGRQCTATAKSTGLRCRDWAVRGGVVCYHHGGNAPQVRRRAKQRLALRDMSAALRQHVRYEKKLLRRIEEGE